MNLNKTALLVLVTLSVTACGGENGDNNTSQTTVAKIKGS
jgi:hypothetical protein